MEKPDLKKYFSGVVRKNWRLERSYGTVLAT
jgi:hypothetical protein